MAAFKRPIRGLLRPTHTHAPTLALARGPWPGCWGIARCQCAVISPLPPLARGLRIPNPKKWCSVNHVNPFAHRLTNLSWTAPTVSRWRPPRALHSLTRSAASLVALQAQRGALWLTTIARSADRAARIGWCVQVAERRRRCAARAAEDHY